MSNSRAALAFLILASFGLLVCEGFDTTTQESFDVSISEEHRLLKGSGGGGGKGGGSGGGKGGGGGSGGGKAPFYGYGGNRIHSDGGGSGFKITSSWGIALLVAITLIPCLCIVGCACFFCKRCKRRKSFEKAVEAARDGVSSKSHGKGGGQTYSAEPFSGEYYVEYDDEKYGDQVSSLQLIFSDSANGYTLSGYSSVTVVEDGHANYNGRAWWVEKSTEKKLGGVKILSKGKFNFKDRSFKGGRLSNLGGSYPYTTFKATEPPPLNDQEAGYRPGGLPVVTGMVQGDPYVPSAPPLTNFNDEPPVVIGTVVQQQPEMY